MHRVAIILNESELLRSGYANITPKLKTIARLSKYAFESFSIVNITSLFSDDARLLHSFDAVIVGTNATSDRAVLDLLRQNAKAFSDFLDAGKGIFVSSQKKLSTEAKTRSDLHGTTQFLPAYYDYHTVERPKIETDSGVGQISTSIEAEQHLLLLYPEKITAEMVRQKCDKNEFRRHCYRSYLVPKTEGVYLSLLKDTSYKEVCDRPLLMVGQIPQNRERVVISTIAIDWEFHDELLTNIVTFIAEGAPKVAFIQKHDSRDGDFDFLLTSAALSKIPHIVYSNIESISHPLKLVHDTYIFAPGWTSAKIIKFLREIESGRFRGSERQPVYRRVYYFQRLDGILTLTQYSSFSTIDLIIDRSALWLNSRFFNRMWGDSFWITHDILFMMRANELSVEPFIAPVLQHIKQHYKNGSYDEVMGATSGLLELLILLHECCLPKCNECGFGTETVKEVCAWICANFRTQSTNDKLAALLVLNRLRDFGSNEQLKNGMFEEVNKEIKAFDLSNENSTEIDVCRHIKWCLISNPNDQERLKDLLSNLKRRQSPDGLWTNTGRTAHVLVFLLEQTNLLSLNKESPETNAVCEEMIYNGVLALRSRYNWANGNWDGDLQATAKSTHAIGLYNARYKYSTQEFLKIMEGETERMQSGNIIRNLSDRFSQLLNDVNKAATVVSALQKAKIQNDRRRKVEVVWRLVAFCSTSLLIGCVAYLAIDDRPVLKEAIKAVGLISVVVAIVFTFVSGWIIERLMPKKVEPLDIEPKKQ